MICELIYMFTQGKCAMDDEDKLTELPGDVLVTDPQLLKMCREKF